MPPKNVLIPLVDQLPPEVEAYIRMLEAANERLLDEVARLRAQNHQPQPSATQAAALSAGFSNLGAAEAEKVRKIVEFRARLDGAVARAPENFARLVASQLNEEQKLKRAIWRVEIVPQGTPLKLSGPIRAEFVCGDKLVSVFPDYMV